MSLTNKQPGNPSSSSTEPINYDEELQKLDELHQLMLELDDQLKDSFLKSELLNLDVAMLFDPEDIVRARELTQSSTDQRKCQRQCDLDETVRENWCFLAARDSIGAQGEGFTDIFEWLILSSCYS